MSLALLFPMACVIAVLSGCASGATGGKDVLHPLDAKAKAKKEKKEDTMPQATP